MVLLPPTRNAFYPSPSMNSESIREIAQQIAVKEVSQAAEQVGGKEVAQSVQQFAAKAVAQATQQVAPKQTIHPRDIYNAAAQHVNKRSPKVVGVMGGFVWRKWMLWLYIGIPVLIILIMIGLVMQKQDYTNRRAALEAEAVAAFEGNKEEDIDHSKIYFNQPWSHKEIKEKKAAEKAKARAAREAAAAGKV